MKRLVKGILVIMLITVVLVGCNNTIDNKVNDNNDEKSRYITLKDSLLDVQVKKIETDEDLTLEVDSVDMDSNGENEKIKVTLSKYKDTKEVKGDTTININESKLVYGFENPNFDIYFINLNKNDKYIDMAIFDDGPSGDPSVFFYRYDGNNILLIGNIQGDFDGGKNPYYGSIKVNGEGIIISPWDRADFVSPNIIFAKNIIENNKFKKIEEDKEKIYNKEYTLDIEDGYFFKQIEENEYKEGKRIYEYLSKKEYFMYDNSNMNKLKKGEKIVLKDVDRLGQLYLIEQSNGKKGVLYFYIGD